MRLTACHSKFLFLCWFYCLCLYFEQFSSVLLGAMPLLLLDITLVKSQPFARFLSLGYRFFCTNFGSFTFSMFFFVIFFISNLLVCTVYAFHFVSFHSTSSTTKLSILYLLENTIYLVIDSDRLRFVGFLVDFLCNIFQC